MFTPETSVSPDIVRIDLAGARGLRDLLNVASYGLRTDAVALDVLLDDASRMLGRDHRGAATSVRAAYGKLDGLAADLARRLGLIDALNGDLARIDQLTTELTAHSRRPGDSHRGELAGERFDLIVDLVGGDRAIAVRVVIALTEGLTIAEATSRVDAELAREFRVGLAMSELALSESEADAYVRQLDAQVSQLMMDGFAEADARSAVTLAETFDLPLVDLVDWTRSNDVSLVASAGQALTARGVGVTMAELAALDGLDLHFQRFDAARREGSDGRVSIEELEYVVRESCHFTAAEVLAAHALLAHPSLLTRLDTAHANEDIFGDRGDASPAGFGSKNGDDGIISDADLRAFMLKAQLHTILGDYGDAIDVGDDPTNIVDGYRSEADFRAFLQDNPDLPEGVTVAAEAMIDAGWFDESWWQEHKGELAMGAALVAGGIVVIASGGTTTFAVVALAGAAGGAAAAGTTVVINLGTDDDLFEDVLGNTLMGAIVGASASGVGHGARAATHGSTSISRLAGVAEATASGTDIVMVGGIDALLAESWEEPVRDWVGPVNAAAIAIDVGFGQMVVSAPMAQFRTIEEQLEALETTVSRQKQLRHLEGSPKLDGGYVHEAADAQRVLDAVHDGSAEILGRTRHGAIVARVDGVEGVNVNSNVAGGSQPTDVFTVKGTAHPSVVPTNPDWSLDGST